MGQHFDGNPGHQRTVSRNSCKMVTLCKMRAIFGLNSEMKSRKEINKQNYQRKRDYIKAQRKLYYSPAQRKLQHDATYSPAQRNLEHKATHTLLLRGNLSTSNRNQQVPKRSAMSSFVIVVLDLHLHLHLTKQTSSFQLRSENR
eukprot:scaffold1647_cov135-Skeletonema_marinoi.AAC.1